MIIYSIIIPTYNSKKTIKRTIDSIIKQSLKSFEVICVDDGSTDNTVQIIKSYNNNIIKILILPHSGLPGKNINYAAKFAKGKYIAILDSDDQWLVNKLLIQHIQISNKYCEVIGCNGYSLRGFYKKELQKISSRFLNIEDLFKSNKIPCSSLVIKKKTFLDLKGFSNNKNLKSLYDYDFLIKSFINNKKLYFLNKKLINYYDNKKNSIRKNDPSFFIQIIFLIFSIVKYRNIKFYKKFTYIFFLIFIRSFNYLTKKIFLNFIYLLLAGKETLSTILSNKKIVRLNR